MWHTYKCMEQLCACFTNQRAEEGAVHPITLCLVWKDRSGTKPKLEFEWFLCMQAYTAGMLHNQSVSHYSAWGSERGTDIIYSVSSIKRWTPWDFFFFFSPGQVHHIFQTHIYTISKTFILEQLLILLIPKTPIWLPNFNFGWLSRETSREALLTHTVGLPY